MALRQVIAQLRELLTRGEQRRWEALLPLMILGGVVETVATGLVFLLIKVASDPGYVIKAEPLASIVRHLPWQGGAGLVVGYGAVLALFFIARSLLLVSITYLQSRAAADTMAGVATRILARYLAAPYAVHLRHTPSELAFNVTKGVEHAINGCLSALVLLASEMVVAAGLALFLILAAPEVTLISGTVLGVLVGISVRITKRSSKRTGALRLGLERRALKDVEQSLGGLRELKVLGREAVFHEAFAAAQRTLAHARRRHATLMALPRLTIETIFVCSVVLIVALVVLGDRRDADLLPLLGVYAYAGFRMIPSANRMLMHLDNLRGTTLALGRLHADWRSFAVAEPRDADETPLEFSSALRLEGVTYSYAGAPRPVLADVSLTIPRGAQVGIVGPTGAGKSTLIDLILGLLDPTAGSITVDGVPLAAGRRAWQRRIGYVPQVAFLFDDSMRRNVALGIPDAEIDERRLAEAVRMAQLDEFVAQLPDGLETRVGERGVRLSGGQRQRVAIARALYHEPELLVFDEATAALDNATERDVTAAIEGLRGKKTLIIIAHRLTTVRRCDTLVFLQAGRVAAIGPYDRLLEESAEFRAMAAPSPAVQSPISAP